MDVVLTAALAIVFLYVLSGLRVFKEYEGGVMCVLGRSWGAKGPGLRFLPPLLTKIQTVSLRVVAMDIPPQDVITRDNISIKVNAVLYMRVADPVKAFIGIENFRDATIQLAQTTLRSVLGETELDELLMNREKINNILKNIIDKRAEDWGIEVSAVEVKDVDLPPEMKRAMARQAEAERERRAKVINAEGELQASEKLAQAAHIIGSEPAAIQLRYLQTVTEISSENNSTTFFPIPIDLFKGFLEAVARKPATPVLPEKTSGDTVPAEPTKAKAKAERWRATSSAERRSSASSSVRRSCKPVSRTSARGSPSPNCSRWARTSGSRRATCARRCSKSGRVLRSRRAAACWRGWWAPDGFPRSAWSLASPPRSIARSAPGCSRRSCSR